MAFNLQQIASHLCGDSLSKYNTDSIRHQAPHPPSHHHLHLLPPTQLANLRARSAAFGQSIMVLRSVLCENL